jgi:hypothetical protein
MTSILPFHCCCTEDCTKKGLVRICWSFSSVFKAVYKIEWVDGFECLDCTNGPFGPESCTTPSCPGLPDYGECNCVFVDTLLNEPCLIYNRTRSCASTFSAGSFCLDFTYKSTTSSTGLPAVNWVYYDGTTFTTTNLSYTFNRLTDVYDDNVVVAYTNSNIAGTTCLQAIDAAIGTTLGTGDYDCTQAVAVRYNRRGTYASGPSPFTIRRQTGLSNARFYAIEDVAGVKSFVIKNAAGTTVYTVNMTTKTLEQLRADLDAHTTNPMVCVSAMNVTTGALPSTLLPYRGNTAIPSSTSAAVGVWAVVAGTKTEYYQVDTVAPSWTAPFPAALKNDANPNLAFTSGYDDAAEADFCFGYKGVVDDIDCTSVPCWYPQEATYGCPNDIWAGCATPALITPQCSGVGVRPCLTIASWGQRPGPLSGSGAFSEVTSDDRCETQCLTSVVRYSCDGLAFDCFADECPVGGGCLATTDWSGWKMTGSFTLERIV